MATFLSSMLVVGALQGSPTPPTPPTPTPPPVGAESAATDSVARVRQRLARDSTDPATWLLLGRRYFERATEPGSGDHGAPPDSAVVRAALDTAEGAFVRVGILEGAGGSRATAVGDSARVLRVGVWAARARLTWARLGVAAGLDEWGPLPTDLHVPAVLEELGENLLRDCPVGGVLLTATEADGDGAWYMRFARGLRPDLLVLRLAAWRADPALRARLARDLKLGRSTDGERWLDAVAQRRPLCASMAFERPPEGRPRLAWAARSVVWVTGAKPKSPRVPARDFVFAALRLGLDAHDPWTEPALATYTRGARATRALCDAMAPFGVATDVASCRRGRSEPGTHGS